MTAYRFRVKLDADPTALWRDIVVGGDRTIAEFQSVLNRAVGLNQAHLWFVGTDEDYLQSDIQQRLKRSRKNNLLFQPISGDI